MTQIEALRPLTAGELLDIRRGVTQEDWPGEELALRCNAAVLAACCFREEERVFADGEAVLRQMTVTEMETLLARLLRGGGRLAEVDGGGDFDEARFRALRGERG